MRIVALPDGEQVPALGQGTWMIGERSDRRLDEIAQASVCVDKAPVDETRGACLLRLGVSCRAGLHAWPCGTGHPNQSAHELMLQPGASTPSCIG